MRQILKEILGFLIIIVSLLLHKDLIAHDNPVRRIENQTAISTKDSSILNCHITGEIVLTTEIFPNALDSSFKYSFVGFLITGDNIVSIDEYGVKLNDNSKVLAIIINTDDLNEYSIENCLNKRDLLKSTPLNSYILKSKTGNVEFKEFCLTLNLVKNEKVMQLLGEYHDCRIFPSLRLHCENRKLELLISDIIPFKPYQ